MAMEIFGIDMSSEFSEVHLRCTASRDARFIGKRIGFGEIKDTDLKSELAEIFITLAGSYILYFKAVRKNNSELSMHYASDSFESISKFAEKSAFYSVYKIALHDAGHDDAVHIP